MEDGGYRELRQARGSPGDRSNSFLVGRADLRANMLRDSWKARYVNACPIRLKKIRIAPTALVSEVLVVAVIAVNVIVEFPGGAVTVTVVVGTVAVAVLVTVEKQVWEGVGFVPGPMKLSGSISAHCGLLLKSKLFIISLAIESR